MRTGKTVNCERWGNIHFLLYHLSLLCHWGGGCIDWKAAGRRCDLEMMTIPIWETQVTCSLRWAVQHMSALVLHHPSHALMLLHYVCCTTFQPLQQVRRNHFNFSCRTLSDKGNRTLHTWPQGTVPKICKCLLSVKQPKGVSCRPRFLDFFLSKNQPKQTNSALAGNTIEMANDTVTLYFQKSGQILAEDWAEKHLSHQWICVNGFGVSVQRLAWCSVSVSVSRQQLRFKFKSHLTHST